MKNFFRKIGSKFYWGFRWVRACLLPRKPGRFPELQSIMQRVQNGPYPIKVTFDRGGYPIIKEVGFQKSDLQIDTVNNPMLMGPKS